MRARVRACLRACNYLGDVIRRAIHCVRVSSGPPRGDSPDAVSTDELTYRGTEIEADFLDPGGIMKPYGDDI